MAQETFALMSLTISGFILVLTLILFHLGREKIRRLEDVTEELSENQAELIQIEEHVLKKDPDYEDFERTISELSEKLFNLIRDRYGFEDVTTYKEMIDSLEDLESEDPIVEDIITFFEYLEEIEYSEEEIDEKDKALVRQAAFRLLRKSGSTLEELEDHRVE